jgi:hypothetical protein
MDEKDNFTPYAVVSKAVEWFKKPGYFDMKTVAEKPGNELYGPEGTVLGASDAYRHIVGSALYARKFGDFIAKNLGDYNEWKLSEQDRDVYKEESEMDRINNAIGLDIAKKAKTEEDVYRLAKEAIEKKKAFYYDNITANRKRIETDRKKAGMLN